MNPIDQLAHVDIDHAPNEAKERLRHWTASPFLPSIIAVLIGVSLFSLIPADRFLVMAAMVTVLGMLVVPALALNRKPENRLPGQRS